MVGAGNTNKFTELS